MGGWHGGWAGGAGCEALYDSWLEFIVGVEDCGFHDISEIEIFMVPQLKAIIKEARLGDALSSTIP
jgi:hypothetical protein